MILPGVDSNVRAAAALAVKVAADNGIKVTVTSGYRSLEKQAALRADYEQCQAGNTAGRDCRYPANRPGNSAHNFGLAFDSTVSPSQLPAWNFIRQWAGFALAANDAVHAEVPNWRKYVGG